ncbi:MAG: NADH-quinone oxidoreductase subunit L, partial [Candidatus Promineifilaceae bacterium]
MASWLVIVTIFLPWLGGLVVWAARDSRPRLQHGLASGFALASAAAALALLPLATDEVVLSIAMGGVFGDFTLTPNGFGVLLAVIATVVGSLAVLFSIDYMHGEAQLGRYYSLVLLFIGAMAGLVLSASLLFMFFFWEITAFCSYALISFHNDDPKAVAGGIKALIMTQVGGAGLLAGALITLSYLDSYQIDVFLAGAASIPPTALSLTAFGFLAAAIAKSAQVPLHTWLPDAMEAPTPVTALIHAATMVNAGVYLLARFYPALAPVPGWKTAVMIAGLLSALLAAVMAITATDLKRALAYSTISQLGYMFYAVGAGAIFASQFHLFSHALFKGLLFLSAGAVIHAVGTRDMRRMGALGKQMPFVRLVFIIGALALAGIPLTTGFFSKELLLEEGLNLGPTWAFALMVIGAGLTALYATRMVAMVFYGPGGEARAAHDAGRAMRVSLALLALG